MMSKNPKKTRKPARKGSPKNKQQQQKGNGPTVTVPVAIASKQSNKKPKISYSPKKGEVRVAHRELILNLTGSLDWEVQASFPIQPGSGVTFPWLSKTYGRGYEQYVINEMSVEYISRCGTSVPGSISIIPDYDPSDDAPVTEFIASTYQNMVEDAVWKNVTCRLDPSALKGGRTRHFTRTIPFGSELDTKAYDCGTIFIATSDNASDAVAVGKVWIDYDITFFVPQLPPNGSDEIIGGQVLGSGGMSPSDPLGTPILDVNSVGITVQETSSQDFIFINSEGEYLIAGYFNGTGLTAGGLNYGSGVNLLGATGIIEGGVSLYFISTVHIDQGYEIGTNYFYPHVTGSSVTSSRILIGRAPDGSLAIDTLFNNLSPKKALSFVSQKDTRKVLPEKKDKNKK